MHPCARMKKCSNPQTDSSGNYIPRFTPTPFCVSDTALIRDALVNSKVIYMELGLLLPRESFNVGGDKITIGKTTAPLPLKLEVLTLQEDLQVTAYDIASRLRGFVCAPRRPRVAMCQDVDYLQNHLSQILALDGGETGAEFGLWLLAWQSKAMRALGKHRTPERKQAPCPVCDMKALVRQYGDDHIECRACGKIVSLKEYDAWSAYLTMESNR